MVFCVLFQYEVSLYSCLWITSFALYYPVSVLHSVAKRLIWCGKTDQTDRERTAFCYGRNTTLHVCWCESSGGVQCVCHKKHKREADDRFVFTWNLSHIWPFQIVTDSPVFHWVPVYKTRQNDSDSGVSVKYKARQMRSREDTLHKWYNYALSELTYNSSVWKIVQHMCWLESGAHHWLTAPGRPIKNKC